MRLVLSLLTIALVSGEKRKNFLLITTDQERTPPSYEDPRLKLYRETEFTGRNNIAKHGKTFKNHYIAATACVASRACLYTGQHLDLHGVDSTDGLAKKPGDGGLHWLDTEFVPTMGDYFKANGYDTPYFGKWHISHEDIPDDNGIIQSVRNVDGSINQDMKERYRKENMLGKYGFSDWVGPEPHGAAYEMSGTVRDIEYVYQVNDWINARNASDNERPFVLSVNLVNPHDICLFQGAVWALFDLPITDGKCPGGLALPPTATLDLSKKPKIYQQYVGVVNKYFSKHRRKIWTIEQELCFYYYLLKVVDDHIASIYETLQQSRFFEDTVVILTSDHGELLYAHGQGIEKWHNAYEETVRVPFVVSNPKLFPDGKSLVDDKALTNHLDILPTMLSLAGIDQEKTNKLLLKTHSQARTLPGKDLTPVVLTGNADGFDTVFFYTRDSAFYGASALSPLGFLLGRAAKYLLSGYHVDAPWGTNSVHMVVTRLEDGKRYKLIEFFDDPKKWNSPNINHTYQIIEEGGVLAGMGELGDVLTRTATLPSEFELFCLDEDPSEATNLQADKPELLKKMQVKLEQVRARILLQPSLPFPSSPDRPHFKPGHSSFPLVKKYVRRVGSSFAVIVICTLLYKQFIK